MDVSHLLDELNDAQREAVTAEDGHVLVLAGAGSGKTRVLVHRIAWLIQVHHVSPMGLLAVTFTNKAAGEMRARVGQLLGLRPDGLWIGTFHGICHRILRMHAADVGLPETFQILDSEDQYRLIRRVIRDMELDEGEYPARRMQGFINHHKDEGRRPEHIEPFDNPHALTQVAIYRNYQDYCERSGLVDFAELLLRTLELLRDNPARQQQYRDRFGHILIDEFQDTNKLQYALVRIIAGDRARLFVVGDDDQSIYGWRGARVENVSDFARDFDPAMIRLEQNYRSTETILEAANRVIANNDERMGKNLWTEGEKGEPIRIFSAFSAEEEADFVIARIRDWLEQGGAASEAAVLYRSNAQSRLFEHQLLAEGIPYRVYGGQRFFERAEIKDAMGYLRLVHNRGDDPAFERVVNVPARGIGERTVAAIREHARSADTSLFAAATAMRDGGAFAARAGNAVAQFLHIIDDLDRRTRDASLGELMSAVVETADLARWYRQREAPDRAETREENLTELIRAAETFDQPLEDEQSGLSPLASFLSQAALEAGEHQGQKWQDCVQLMTLHSAKGLEFPLVFLSGMEEGLFPHQKSTEEPGRLSEERRLCYVGMTRAMQRLYLTYAESRMLHGQTSTSYPSRFLDELPEELTEQVRPRAARYAGAAFGGGAMAQPAPEHDFSLGSTVSHERFGIGTVVNVEGSGPNARVQINFETAGQKWLVLSYANLERLD
ncbi:MAG: DNA helicase II [Gammaproteobacteria bacterium]|jgi:DNA helicase-2/ATP-dependent DNA helicase PcrA|nr:DNA helicase II [Gammaproteobacteria bacterium]